MSIGFSIKRLEGNRQRWFSRTYAIVGCVVRFASLFVGIDAVLLTCNIPIQSQPNSVAANSVAAQFSRSPIQSHPNSVAAAAAEKHTSLDNCCD